MIRIHILLILLFFFGASDAQTVEQLIAKAKNDAEIVIPGITDEPGIGKNDGEPEGAEFKLPPGMRFVERPGHRFDPESKNIFGICNTFFVDLHIVNDNVVKDSTDKLSAPPSLLIFPPGISMLHVGHSGIQNGLLGGRIRINVPPAGGGGDGIPDTVTVYLGMVCLNADKGLPWESNPNDEANPDVAEYPIKKGAYRPGKVLGHKGLLMLIELLSHYPKLSVKQFHNPQLYVTGDVPLAPWMEIHNTVQLMFWKVTDGPGITRGELREFKEKLEPYK